MDIDVKAKDPIRFDDGWVYPKILRIFIRRTGIEENKPGPSGGRGQRHQKETKNQNGSREHGRLDQKVMVNGLLRLSS